MNKHVIRYTLGKMIRIEGLLMLLPALVGLIYREKTGFVYLGTGLVIFVLGYFLGKNKPKKDTIYPREGFLIVALAWLVLSFLAHFLSISQRKFLISLMLSLKLFQVLPQQVLLF